MSSRPNRWFCHECQAEMQPIMAPDPQCSRCHGSFVEQIENPADDPRDFIQAGRDGDDDMMATEDFLSSLQNLMRMPPPPARAAGFGSGATQTPGRSSGFTLNINRSGDATRTSFSRTGEVPLLSEFVSRNGGRPGQDPDPINGQLMFQYLLAMLGRGGPSGSPFGAGIQPGRMGDYVFNQEALDQIMTQLMESTSAHPVPAPEDVMDKLPREVLEEGSPLLEKDCAVCKEQFVLGTEDPDEQVVVTLPCKHPFHEPCIMPWLKSSATCPVCRYQLVPQPSHHAPGPGPPSGSGGNNDQPSPGPNEAGQGFIGNLLTMLGGGASGSNNAPAAGSANNASTPTGRRNSGDASGRSRHDLPGSWDSLD